jgi:hypothetical protein
MRRWEGNIKMEIKNRMGGCGMDILVWTSDRVCEKLMNTRVTQNRRNILETISFCFTQTAGLNYDCMLERLSLWITLSSFTPAVPFAPG